jgi:type VI secretion system protein ImpM
VPEILTSAAPGGALRDVTIGFHGKIPARGDFLQGGLPRSFTDAWDVWMMRMMRASRAMLREEWLPAWLEAPVWRFALSPGTCGPGAVIGLWMPSVDTVGRYFPLTLAAVAPPKDIRELMRGGLRFLAAAEELGRNALANVLPPEELAARLAAVAAARLTDEGADAPVCPTGATLWWTDGAPRVPPGTFADTGLPDENLFCAMLNPCVSISQAASPELTR